MRYLPLLLLVLAGAAITTQSAVNSQLRGALHQNVLWAVLISYVGGSVVAAGLLLLTRTATPSLADFGGLKWYCWTGGLLGVGYVLTITFSLQRVGAARLFALVVAGQLLSAALFDQLGLFGLARGPVSPSRLLGVALMVAGAYLLNRY